MSEENKRILRGDCWNGVINREWHVDKPSLAEMDRMLRRLDAKTYTMLTIEGKAEAHLSIGGGAGQYVVYATFDNQEFWNLLRSVPADGVVLLNAGGQVGDFPAGQVVGLDQAREAGRAFLEMGQLDAKQHWKAG